MSVRIYIVMAPPLLSAADGGGEWEADQMVFVKDGFSLPALIIPELWLLWHRMWIPLVGYLGYRILIGLLAHAIGDATAGMIAFLLAILFALEANNLRRWSLGRKGWRIVGETIGRSRSEAEFLFFRDWAAKPAAVRRTEDRAGTRTLRPTRPAPEPAVDEPKVFGLFPDPEPDR